MVSVVVCVCAGSCLCGCACVGVFMRVYVCLCAACCRIPSWECMGFRAVVSGVGCAYERVRICAPVEGDRETKGRGMFGRYIFHTHEQIKAPPPRTRGQITPPREKAVCKGTVKEVLTCRGVDRMQVGPIGKKFPLHHLCASGEFLDPTRAEPIGASILPQSPLHLQPPPASLQTRNNSQKMVRAPHKRTSTLTQPLKPQHAK